MNFLRRGFGASIDNQLSRLDRSRQFQGQLGNEVIADQIYNCNVTQATVGAEGHFEVSDFRASVVQTSVDIFCQFAQQVIAIPTLSGTELHGAVEPAEQSFT